MSDTVQEQAPKLSILEQLRVQHAQFVSQRDMTQTNLNQLIGAIYACELMIKKHEEEQAQKEDENQGDEQNVEPNCEDQEQAA